MIYLKIFLVFAKIGLFSFGGGYAVLAMINNEVVDRQHWITNTEFIDVVAISQSTPGPIAINSATYIGYKIAPIPVLGSVVATVGVVMPSLIIMLVLSIFYLKFKNNRYIAWAVAGLKPVVVGLIAAAAVVISPDAYHDYISLLLFVAVFLLAWKAKWDPVLLTVISGVAGYFLF